MRFVLFFMLFLLNGCLLLIEDDCDPWHPDFSHTEYDCYDARERVDVCNVQYCWEETRTVSVCDEYHVCNDRRRRR